MSLLRDIQDAATSSSIELTTVLRKCKILAARLGNNELKEWIDKELNGYNQEESLPDYRIVPVHSKGNFISLRGQQLNNTIIPMSKYPEEFRKDLEYAYFSQPIASLISLLESADGGNAQEPWLPDLVALVGRKIYNRLNCLEAWKVIPSNSIAGVIDAVRNRVLNFVLEIEAEAPDAGEAPINSSPIPQEKVNQIFYTKIYGNVQNFAAGNRDVNQDAKIEKSNDKLFSELLQALSDLKTDKESISQLTVAIEEMRASQGTSNFKRHYLSFMSILADHMQVFGPIVAPYLPALANLMP